MKEFLSSAFNAYKEYRSFRKRNRIFKIVRYSVMSVLAAYLLTIMFPQFLFAHEKSHGNFRVYATEPLDERLVPVLDAAEARLKKSPLYDAELKSRVFLTGSHAFYAFLSNKSYASFGNSVPGIDNIFINKTDLGTDSVFVNRAERNRRSLSGVVAHEVTHVLIKNRFGWIRSVVLIPTWKKEGYCEYVAGESTLSYEEGVRLWKLNKSDVRLSYFKYHMMVKYLLEKENLSVDELFNREIDEQDLSAKVYESL